MTTIRAFTTPSGFEVEADCNLPEWLKVQGYKPQTKTDSLGVRIVTGVTNIQDLVALLTKFYGGKDEVTLRVFAEGSSRDYQDFKL